MQLEHSNTLGEYYLKAYFTKPLLTINRKNLNKTGDQFECQKQVRLRHTRLKQQKIDHKPELCYEEKFEKCLEVLCNLLVEKKSYVLIYFGNILYIVVIFY